MIRAIDDFMVDRVFQPISDALARWVSCYGIAAFLLTGAIPLAFAAAVMRWSWYAIPPGFLGVMWACRLVQMHQMDTAACSDVLPTERIRDALLRPVFLPFCVYDLMFEILTEVPFDIWLWNQAWLLYTLAIYFMACRKLPPKPRRSHVPEDPVAEAG